MLNDVEAFSGKGFLAFSDIQNFSHSAEIRHSVEKDSCHSPQAEKFGIQ